MLFRNSKKISLKFCCQTFNGIKSFHKSCPLAVQSSSNEKSSKKIDRILELEQKHINGIKSQIFDSFPANDIASKTSVESIKGTLLMEAFLSKFVEFIERFSHMDDVRNAQDRVKSLRDQLEEAGNVRRQIFQSQYKTRLEIKNHHSKICNETRGTDRYVQLIQDEFKLLQQEEANLHDLNKADENERHLFDTLKNAINTSYEKEKIHSNFIKVCSLIIAFTGTLVTLIVSLISYNMHNSKFGALATDIKQSVNDIKTRVNNTVSEIKSMHQKIDDRFADARVQQESWGSYLKRHTRWTYSWMMPKK